ncbi:MAG: hypothetical protein ABJC10_02840 [Acidobacteriota bacterium]
MRLVLFLAAILVAPCGSLTARAQQITEHEIASPVTMRWQRQKGVNKYRMQIAADEKFQNVFLDRRVIGDREVVSELAPGYYYWRVAPAESMVGEFSKPVRSFISGGTVIPLTLPGRTTRSHSLAPITGRKVRSQLFR